MNKVIFTQICPGCGWRMAPREDHEECINPSCGNWAYKEPNDTDSTESA